MKSRASSLSFGLFVIVVLAALYSLMAGHGRTNWGLVTVLGGILLLRVVLFWMNLRQQRHNIERGKGPVRIETRLGLNDEPADPRGAETETEASDAAGTRPTGSTEQPRP